jgi:hypothetical protein
LHLQSGNILKVERALPPLPRRLFPIHFHVPYLHVPSILKIHGVNRLVVRRLGIGGDEQLDVLQADVIKPALGVPGNQAGSLPVGNDVADDDVANRASGRLARLVCLMIAFAAALNSEVDGIAIAPPAAQSTMARPFE